MSALYSHRYVFRGTIQFDTPFLIAAGRDDSIADAVFVADANGLPTIPGSSLAGVLRSLFRETWGDEERLFGFQKRDYGEGSRLSVSWGAIHDSKDCPVVGLLTDTQRAADPVLLRAFSPLLRDHVRINHKGVSDAEERGKFDERAVCAGHRFTFEFEMIGTQEEKGFWDKLIQLLSSPSLRLGGKTRRGYGAFHFVRAASRVFDLTTDFDDYAKHPVSIAESSSVLRELPLPKSEKKNSVSFRLQPRGYWMIGGGYDTLGQTGEADMAPYRDTAIFWKNKKGTVKENVLVIPATAIKGALAHRVAFHYNVLQGVFADTLEEGVSFEDVTGEGNAAIRELFGYCKDSEEDGQRGRIILDDIYIPEEVERELASQLVHHVGIDRFTGGARDSVLFSERPFWQGSPLEITLHITEIDRIKDTQNVLRALQKALEDLAAGRLSFGAGGGRGLGRFMLPSDEEINWPESLQNVLEG